MVEIPDVVRNKAVAYGVSAWLDALPSLIADLEGEWTVTAGRAFSGSTEALVVEATLADGTAAVLKLMMPVHPRAALHEITVLRHADGDGCARLLRSDADRGALLMERLGPPMSELGLTLEERLVALAGAASRLWRPAPDLDLPDGAQKAQSLADFIPRVWDAVDRACSERTVEHALACAERRHRCHDPERAVLVHGDVHQWNALRTDAGFKLVDPDGLLADAEYDLGILMREDPDELLTGDPYDRARYLATLTGRDPVAIWEWGVVERVATGLLCVQIGLEPVGSRMLEAAELIARLDR